MPFARNPLGQRIHYKLVGTEGPPVVLLMGIGVSSRFWFDRPERVATQPGKPRRVLTVDNRGTGESARPYRPFTLGDMADDLAVVLDDAGIERADVVGISLGGMIAQEVAIRHPDRVRGLVLMCTTPGFPLGTFPNPKPVLRLVRGFFNGMRGDDFERLLAPAHRVAEARRARKATWSMVAGAELFDPRMLFYHLLSAAGHSSGLRIRDIRCPTLVVTGADDELISPENSRRIAEAIPGAKLEILPEVGHDILTLAPDAIENSLAYLDSVFAPRAVTPGTGGSSRARA